MSTELRVIVLPGGELQIFVDGNAVSFEQAQAATAAVLAQLQAQGIAVSQVGEVEQHKDGGASHVHVRQGVRHGN